MTTSVLQQFHCVECGLCNWIHTFEHQETEDTHCVRCETITTHEKYNSRGR